MELLILLGTAIYALFWMNLCWRAVRAHEHIANAMENMARTPRVSTWAP